MAISALAHLDWCLACIDPHASFFCQVYTKPILAVLESSSLCGYSVQLATLEAVKLLVAQRLLIASHCNAHEKACSSVNSNGGKQQTGHHQKACSSVNSNGGKQETGHHQEVYEHQGT